ncbi:glycoside hydrolase family 27 protein [Hyaloscypha bicolor E]|uniref:Alpha-galactosidase n=1 Tax=Hyaloscypha bicolor E TaxID=1095630 RepID=A0A2J6TPA3_9HELO|nr:glycoside hydrolase family 27 protein [Hyaloscypha bicolor E]PMD64842.1 glycoside hydrolase family 27 protein [Hyaloscypha bicolor E]
MAFKNLLRGAAVAAFLASKVEAVDNGLAITPQMGWDNWNSFGCDVSETLLLQTAQLIVDYGLKDLGYHYVILDDCWSIGRNASHNNSLIANPEKFPNGMAAVADQLHALGLGFGMYSDAGKYTCGGYAGSLGYETVDANTFAEWGVDYLKYDNCFNMGQAGNQMISSARYEVMANALNATGRPILYSLCNWGEDYPWNWGSTIANSWRISGDVYDSWDQPDSRCPCDGPDAWNCGLPGFHCSVTNIMNKASFIVSKAQPGAWNDLDMLEVGNGAMTDAEYVAHFSMWAAAKSPLILGNDIRVVPAKDLAILSNAAVIAVNQDPSGSSAARRWMYSTDSTDAYGGSALQLWSGSLKSTTGGQYNDMVVLLINGANETMVMNATLADIFVDSGAAGTARQVKISWEARDLWANRMSEAEAQAIIDASSATGNATNGYNATMVGSGRYNATKTSYAQGLKNNDTLLLGNVTTTVGPSGTVTATVERHGAALFRLRALPTGVKKRDEL